MWRPDNFDRAQRDTVSRRLFPKRSPISALVGAVNQLTETLRYRPRRCGRQPAQAISTLLVASTKEDTMRERSIVMPVTLHQPGHHTRWSGAASAQPQVASAPRLLVVSDVKGATRRRSPVGRNRKRPAYDMAHRVHKSGGRRPLPAVRWRARRLITEVGVDGTYT